MNKSIGGKGNCLDKAVAESFFKNRMNLYIIITANHFKN